MMPRMIPDMKVSGSGVGRLIGLVLGVAVLGFLIFLLSPLLILFAWNNVGNELLGWPRISVFHAILVWLAVWAVGSTARGGIQHNSSS